MSDWVVFEDKRREQMRDANQTAEEERKLSLLGEVDTRANARSSAEQQPYVLDFLWD